MGGKDPKINEKRFLKGYSESNCDVILDIHYH